MVVRRVHWKDLRRLANLMVMNHKVFWDVSVISYAVETCFLLYLYLSLECPLFLRCVFCRLNFIDLCYYPISFPIFNS